MGESSSISQLALCPFAALFSFVLIFFLSEDVSFLAAYCGLISSFAGGARWA
jgi:hypothetical protein